MGSFRSRDSVELPGSRAGQGSWVLGRKSDVADDLLALEEHGGEYVYREKGVLRTTKEVFGRKCRRDQTYSEKIRRIRPVLAPSNRARA